MKRNVQPEWLDSLSPDDPRALRSRRDLRRVNWWMGNAAIMSRALRENSPSPPGRITELGAGDGHFLLRVAQKIRADHASGPSRSAPCLATLLDRQKSISPETLAAFAKFGWRAEAVVADAFDWPPAARAEEVVVANLFLHHFEDGRLAELLRKISQRTSLFIAVEPQRSALPAVAGKLLRLIGCSDVTRHDAETSIRAGFAGTEISALWPDAQDWRLIERRAGGFSHLFIARKAN